jgi:type II secretory pathway pseudopilin PulG
MKTKGKFAQHPGENRASAPMDTCNDVARTGGHTHNAAIVPRVYGGFTLVQLLTLLTVFGILAATMTSVFTRGRAAAHQEQCDTHLHDLTTALREFHTENRHFPGALVDLRTKGYLQDESVLHCPSDPDEQGSYGEYYAIRDSRGSNDRPILVCPFHETDNDQKMQAFTGRQTQHGKAVKSQLRGARAATIKRLGQEPIAARGGMEVSGGSHIHTGVGG